MEVDELARTVTSLLNRQVEIFDRIQRLEERMEGLAEQYRQLADRVLHLGKSVGGRPASYR